MKWNNTARARRAIALGACSATVVAGLSFWGINAASAVGDQPLNIVLGVGSNQTEKVVSWYYPSAAQQAIEISEGTTFDSATAQKVVATSSANTVADAVTSTKDDAGTSSPPAAEVGYYNAHVALHDLKANTKYTYHVGAADGSGWSKDYTFYTGTAGSDFTFAAFGDPQIGSSGFTHNDGRGWAKTLDYVASSSPETELLVSTGDQVEHANSEDEWTNWSDPDNSANGDKSSTSPILKQITYAPQIGNHESTGQAYHQHFAPPNEDKNSLFYGSVGATTSTTSQPGGDYWYTYKGVLFIDINSNAYASTGSDAAHAAYIKDVVAKHGTSTKWQVVVFHHSIYSPASHANDADNSQRRKDLTYTMSQEGVDLVIQGHDHAYSRSYELKSTSAGVGASKANAAEQPGAQAVVTGPGGVIYVTADSSSGSKYYDLTAPDTSKNNGDYGPDAVAGNNDANQTRHWANSVESQPYTPTYVQVKVTDAGLDVKNIASQDYNAASNSAYQHTSGIAAKADAGDKRETDPAKIHHYQTTGSISDQFKLTGGNSNAFPPALIQTITKEVPVEVTKEITKEITKEVPPAVLKSTVAKKIKSLHKRIKKAKGAKLTKLKVELSVYKAVQKQLK